VTRAVPTHGRIDYTEPRTELQDTAVTRGR
jgi:hypothetical protein